MNFTNMPELQWKYGYFGIWGVMVAIFILMMMYFRRKKWF
jgi:magnesium transporter